MKIQRSSMQAKARYTFFNLYEKNHKQITTHKKNLFLQCVYIGAACFDGCFSFHVIT